MNRIAVLMGGWSNEREISRISGRHMARAARDLGCETIEIEAGPDLASRLRAAQPDMVLNALHGPFGEDGRVQGLLDILELPYSHSGVLASALGMNKARSREVFAAQGLEVPAGGVFPLDAIRRAHVRPPPYVVKPVAEGSSFGVQVVETGEEPPCLADWPHGALALVEEYIAGRELTCGVLGDRPLAITEIEILTNCYDTSAKYDTGGPVHRTPADIPTALARRIEVAAVTAHRALGCRGATRSDFRFDPVSGRLAILEINTQPGMTPTSLLPEQAAYRGIDYRDLVEWIIRHASHRD